MVLKGLKVDPKNPFHFDFYVSPGDSQFNKQDQKKEMERLIRYFLTSLTVPADDLWVNLSPYEKNRILPDKFAMTEMGRDLLAQDYFLKQITASLIYPESELGQKFWHLVYQKAFELYGTTNIPINTFNKVWIVPEKAVVYENDGAAFVVDAKLDVLLEEDYLSLENNKSDRKFDLEKLNNGQTAELNRLSSRVVKDVILPAIKKEINEGQQFAQLRQIYNSLILALWYKKRLKDSLLSKIYSNKEKMKGVDLSDPESKEKIYNQYLETFRKGVYNLIKEEVDPATQELVPRKYISGGAGFQGAVNILETEGKLSTNATDDQQKILSENEKRRLLQTAVDVVTIPQTNPAANGPNPTDTLMLSAEASRDGMYTIYKDPENPRNIFINDQEKVQQLRLKFSGTDQAKIELSDKFKDIPDHGHVVIPYQNGGALVIAKNIDASVTVFEVDAAEQGSERVKQIRFDDKGDLYSVIREPLEELVYDTSSRFDLTFLYYLNLIWDSVDERLQSKVSKLAYQIQYWQFNSIKSKRAGDMQATMVETGPGRLYDLDRDIVIKFLPMISEIQRPWLITDYGASTAVTSLDITNALKDQDVRVESSDLVVFLRMRRIAGEVYVYDSQGNVQQKIGKNGVVKIDEVEKIILQKFFEEYDKKNKKYFEFMRTAPEVIQHINAQQVPRLSVVERDVFDQRLPKNQSVLGRVINFAQYIDKRHDLEAMLKNMGRTIKNQGFLFVGRSMQYSIYRVWQRRGAKLVELEHEGYPQGILYDGYNGVFDLTGPEIDENGHLASITREDGTIMTVFYDGESPSRLDLAAPDGRQITDTEEIMAFLTSVESMGGAISGLSLKDFIQQKLFSLLAQSAVQDASRPRDQLMLTKEDIDRDGIPFRQYLGFINSKYAGLKLAEHGPIRHPRLIGFVPPDISFFQELIALNGHGSSRSALSTIGSLENLPLVDSKDTKDFNAIAQRIANKEINMPIIYKPNYFANGDYIFFIEWSDDGRKLILTFAQWEDSHTGEPNPIARNMINEIKKTITQAEENTSREELFQLILDPQKIDIAEALKVVRKVVSRETGSGVLEVVEPIFKYQDRVFQTRCSWIFDRANNTIKLDPQRSFGSLGNEYFGNGTGIDSGQMYQPLFERFGISDEERQMAFKEYVDKAVVALWGHLQKQFSLLNFRLTDIERGEFDLFWLPPDENSHGFPVPVFNEMSLFSSEANGRPIYPKSFDELEGIHANNSLGYEEVLTNGLSLEEFLEEVSTKYGARKIAEGGPILQSPLIALLAPEEVILRKRKKKKLNSYSWALADPREIKSFSEIAKQIGDGRIKTPLYYKPDSSSDGVGVFRIDRDRKKNFVVTMAYFETYKGDSFFIYTGKLIKDLRKELGVEVKIKRKSDTVQVIINPRQADFPNILERIRRILSLQATFEYDPGILEQGIRVFRYQGKSYETRHAWQVDERGDLLIRRDEERKDIFDLETIARVGSSGEFANVSDRNSSETVVLEYAEMYDPLFARFHIPEERKQEFYQYVEENVRRLYQYILLRMVDMGMNEMDKIYLKGSFDFMWLPPTKNSNGLPIPVLNETNLDDVNAMDRGDRVFPKRFDQIGKEGSSPTAGGDKFFLSTEQERFVDREFAGFQNRVLKEKIRHISIAENLPAALDVLKTANVNVCRVKGNIIPDLKSSDIFTGLNFEFTLFRLRERDDWLVIKRERDGKLLDIPEMLKGITSFREPPSPLNYGATALFDVILHSRRDDFPAPRLEDLAADYQDNIDGKTDMGIVTPRGLVTYQGGGLIEEYPGARFTGEDLLEDLKQSYQIEKATSGTDDQTEVMSDFLDSLQRHIQMEYWEWESVADDYFPARSFHLSRCLNSADPSTRWNALKFLNHIAHELNNPHLTDVFAAFAADDEEKIQDVVIEMMSEFQGVKPATITPFTRSQFTRVKQKAGVLLASLLRNGPHQRLERFERIDSVYRQLAEELKSANGKKRDSIDSFVPRIVAGMRGMDKGFKAHIRTIDPQNRNIFIFFDEITVHLGEALCGYVASVGLLWGLKQVGVYELYDVRNPANILFVVFDEGKVYLRHSQSSEWSAGLSPRRDSTGRVVIERKDIQSLKVYQDFVKLVTGKQVMILPQEVSFSRPVSLAPAVIPSRAIAPIKSPPVADLPSPKVQSSVLSSVDKISDAESAIPIPAVPPSAELLDRLAHEAEVALAGQAEASKNSMSLNYLKVKLTYHLTGLVNSYARPQGGRSKHQEFDRLTSISHPELKLYMLNYEGRLYLKNTISNTWSKGIEPAITATATHIPIPALLNNQVYLQFVRTVMIRHFADQAIRDKIVEDEQAWKVYKTRNLRIAPIEFRLPSPTSEAWKFLGQPQPGDTKRQFVLGRGDDGEKGGFKRYTFFAEVDKDGKRSKNYLFFLETPSEVMIFDHQGLLVTYPLQESYVEAAKRNVFIDSFFMDLSKRYYGWKTGFIAEYYNEKNDAWVRNLTIGKSGSGVTLVFPSTKKMAVQRLKNSAEINGAESLAKIMEEETHYGTEIVRLSPQEIYFTNGIGKLDDPQTPVYIFHGDHFYIPAVAQQLFSQGIVSHEFLSAFGNVDLKGSKGLLVKYRDGIIQYRVTQTADTRAIKVNGQWVNRRVCYIHEIDSRGGGQPLDLPAIPPIFTGQAEDEIFGLDENLFKPYWFSAAPASIPVVISPESDFRPMELPAPKDRNEILDRIVEEAEADLAVGKQNIVEYPKMQVSVGQVRVNLGYHLEGLIKSIHIKRQNTPENPGFVKLVDRNDENNFLYMVTFEGQTYVKHSANQEWSEQDDLVPTAAGGISEAQLRKALPYQDFVRSVVLHRFGTAAAQGLIIQREDPSFTKENPAFWRPYRSSISFGAVGFNLPSIHNEAWKFLIGEDEGLNRSGKGRIILIRGDEKKRGAARYSYLVEADEQGNFTDNYLFFVDTINEVFAYDKNGLLTVCPKPLGGKYVNRNVFIDTFFEELVEKYKGWNISSDTRLSNSLNVGGDSKKTRVTFYRGVNIKAEKIYSFERFGWEPVARVTNVETGYSSEIARIGENQIVFLNGIGDLSDPEQPVYVIDGLHVNVPRLVKQLGEQRGPGVVSEGFRNAFGQDRADLIGDGKYIASEARYEVVTTDRVIPVKVKEKWVSRKVCYVHEIRFGAAPYQPPAEVPVYLGEKRHQELKVNPFQPYWLESVRKVEPVIDNVLPATFVKEEVPPVSVGIPPVTLTVEPAATEKAPQEPIAVQKNVVPLEIFRQWAKKNTWTVTAQTADGLARQFGVPSETVDAVLAEFHIETVQGNFIDGLEGIFREAQWALSLRSADEFEKERVKESSVFVRVKNVSLQMGFYLSELVASTTLISKHPGQPTTKAIVDLDDPTNFFLVVSVGKKIYFKNSKSDQWAHDTIRKTNVNAEEMLQKPVYREFVNRTLINHFGSPTTREQLIKDRPQGEYKSFQKGGIYFGRVLIKTPADRSIWEFLPEALDYARDADRGGQFPRYKILLEKNNPQNYLCFVRLLDKVVVYDRHGVLFTVNDPQRLEQPVKIITDNYFIGTFFQDLLKRYSKYENRKLKQIKSGGLARLALGAKNGVEVKMDYQEGMSADTPSMLSTYGMVPIAVVKDGQGNVAAEFYRVGKNKLICSLIGNIHDPEQAIQIFNGNRLNIPSLLGQLGKSPAPSILGTKYEVLPSDLVFPYWENGHYQGRRTVFIVPMGAQADISDFFFGDQQPVLNSDDEKMDWEERQLRPYWLKEWEEKAASEQLSRSAEDLAVTYHDIQNEIHMGTQSTLEILAQNSTRLTDHLRSYLQAAHLEKIPILGDKTELELPDVRVIFGHYLNGLVCSSRISSRADSGKVRIREVIDRRNPKNFFLIASDGQAVYFWNSISQRWSSGVTPVDGKIDKDMLAGIPEYTEFAEDVMIGHFTDPVVQGEIIKSQWGKGPDNLKEVTFTPLTLKIKHQGEVRDSILSKRWARVHQDPDGSSNVVVYFVKKNKNGQPTSHLVTILSTPAKMIVIRGRRIERFSKANQVVVTSQLVNDFFASVPSLQPSEPSPVESSKVELPKDLPVLKPHVEKEDREEKIPVEAVVNKQNKAGPVDLKQVLDFVKSQMSAIQAPQTIFSSETFTMGATNIFRLPAQLVGKIALLSFSKQFAEGVHVKVMVDQADPQNFNILVVEQGAAHMISSQGTAWNTMELKSDKEVTVYNFDKFLAMADFADFTDRVIVNHFKDPQKNMAILNLYPYKRPYKSIKFNAVRSGNVEFIMPRTNSEKWRSISVYLKRIIKSGHFTALVENDENGELKENYRLIVNGIKRVFVFDRYGLVLTVNRPADANQIVMVKAPEIFESFFQDIENRTDKTNWYPIPMGDFSTKVELIGKQETFKLSYQDRPVIELTNLPFPGVLAPMGRISSQGGDVLSEIIYLARGHYVFTAMGDLRDPQNPFYVIVDDDIDLNALVKKFPDLFSETFKGLCVVGQQQGEERNFDLQIAATEQKLFRPIWNNGKVEWREVKLIVDQNSPYWKRNTLNPLIALGHRWWEEPQYFAGNGPNDAIFRPYWMPQNLEKAQVDKGQIPIDDQLDADQLESIMLHSIKLMGVEQPDAASLQTLQNDIKSFNENHSNSFAFTVAGRGDKKIRLGSRHVLLQLNSHDRYHLQLQWDDALGLIFHCIGKHTISLGLGYHAQDPLVSHLVANIIARSSNVATAEANIKKLHAWMKSHESQSFKFNIRTLERETGVIFTAIQIMAERYNIKFQEKANAGAVAILHDELERVTPEVIDQALGPQTSAVDDLSKKTSNEISKDVQSGLDTLLSDQGIVDKKMSYQLEDGPYVIKLWGIRLPREDAGQRNVLELDQLKKLNQFPGATVDGSQPFCLVKVSIKTGDVPVAYTVLYPSGQGLKLVKSQSDEYIPTPLRIYDQLTEKLEGSVVAAHQETKRFHQSSFHMAASYISYYYFRKHFLKERNRAKAISQAYFEIKNLFPEEPIKPEIITYILTLKQSETHSWSGDVVSCIRLYIHYLESFQTDILQRYQEIRKTNTNNFGAAVQLMRELRNLEDCPALTVKNLMGLLSEFAVDVRGLQNPMEMYFLFMGRANAQGEVFDLAARYAAAIKMGLPPLWAFLQLRTDALAYLLRSGILNAEEYKIAQLVANGHTADDIQAATGMTVKAVNELINDERLLILKPVILQNLLTNLNQPAGGQLSYYCNYYLYYKTKIDLYQRFVELRKTENESVALGHLENELNKVASYQSASRETLMKVLESFGYQFQGVGLSDIEHVYDQVKSGEVTAANAPGVVDYLVAVIAYALDQRLDEIARDPVKLKILLEHINKFNSYDLSITTDNKQILINLINRFKLRLKFESPGHFKVWLDWEDEIGLILFLNGKKVYGFHIKQELNNKTPSMKNITSFIESDDLTEAQLTIQACRRWCRFHDHGSVNVTAKEIARCFGVSYPFIFSLLTSHKIATEWVGDPQAISHLQDEIQQIKADLSHGQTEIQNPSASAKMAQAENVPLVEGPIKHTEPELRQTPTIKLLKELNQLYGDLEAQLALPDSNPEEILNRGADQIYTRLQKLAPQLNLDEHKMANKDVILSVARVKLWFGGYLRDRLATISAARRHFGAFDIKIKEIIDVEDVSHVLLAVSIKGQSRFWDSRTRQWTAPIAPADSGEIKPKQMMEIPVVAAFMNQAMLNHYTKRDNVEDLILEHWDPTPKLLGRVTFQPFEFLLPDTREAQWRDLQNDDVIKVREDGTDANRIVALVQKASNGQPTNHYMTFISLPNLVLVCYGDKKMIYSKLESQKGYQRTRCPLVAEFFANVRKYKQEASSLVDLGELKKIRQETGVSVGSRPVDFDSLLAPAATQMDEVRGSVPSSGEENLEPTIASQSSVGEPDITVGENILADQPADVPTAALSEINQKIERFLSVYQQRPEQFFQKGIETKKFDYHFGDFEIHFENSLSGLVKTVRPTKTERGALQGCKMLIDQADPSNILFLIMYRENLILKNHRTGQCSRIIVPERGTNSRFVSMEQLVREEAFADFALRTKVNHLTPEVRKRIAGNKENARPYDFTFHPAFQFGNLSISTPKVASGSRGFLARRVKRIGGQYLSKASQYVAFVECDDKGELTENYLFFYDAITHVLLYDRNGLLNVYRKPLGVRNVIDVPMDVFRATFYQNLQNKEKWHSKSYPASVSGKNFLTGRHFIGGSGDEGVTIIFRHQGNVNTFSPEGRVSMFSWAPVVEFEESGITFARLDRQLIVSSGLGDIYDSQQPVYILSVGKDVILKDFASGDFAAPIASSKFVEAFNIGPGLPNRYRIQRTNMRIPVYIEPKAGANGDLVEQGHWESRTAYFIVDSTLDWDKQHPALGRIHFDFSEVKESMRDILVPYWWTNEKPAAVEDVPVSKPKPSALTETVGALEKVKEIIPSPLSVLEPASVVVPKVPAKKATKPIATPPAAKGKTVNETMGTKPAKPVDESPKGLRQFIKENYFKMTADDIVFLRSAPGNEVTLEQVKSIIREVAAEDAAERAAERAAAAAQNAIDSAVEETTDEVNGDQDHIDTAGSSRGNTKIDNRYKPKEPMVGLTEIVKAWWQLENEKEGNVDAQQNEIIHFRETSSKLKNVCKKYPKWSLLESDAKQWIIAQVVEIKRGGSAVFTNLLPKAVSRWLWSEEQLDSFEFLFEKPNEISQGHFFTNKQILSVLQRETKRSEAEIRSIIDVAAAHRINDPKLLTRLLICRTNSQEIIKMLPQFCELRTHQPLFTASDKAIVDWLASIDTIISDLKLAIAQDKIKLSGHQNVLRGFPAFGIELPIEVFMGICQIILPSQMGFLEKRLDEQRRKGNEVKVLTGQDIKEIERSFQVFQSNVMGVLARFPTMPSVKILMREIDQNKSDFLCFHLQGNIGDQIVGSGLEELQRRFELLRVRGTDHWVFIALSPEESLEDGIRRIFGPDLMGHDTTAMNGKKRFERGIYSPFDVVLHYQPDFHNYPRFEEVGTFLSGNIGNTTTMGVVSPAYLPIYDAQNLLKAFPAKIYDSNDLTPEIRRKSENKIIPILALEDLLENGSLDIDYIPEDFISDKFFSRIPFSLSELLQSADPGVRWHALGLLQELSLHTNLLIEDIIGRFANDPDAALQNRILDDYVYGQKGFEGKAIEAFLHSPFSLIRLRAKMMKADLAGFPDVPFQFNEQIILKMQDEELKPIATRLLESDFYTMFDQARQLSADQVQRLGSIIDLLLSRMFESAVTMGGKEHPLVEAAQYFVWKWNHLPKSYKYDDLLKPYPSMPLREIVLRKLIATVYSDVGEMAQAINTCSQHAKILQTIELKPGQDPLDLAVEVLKRMGALILYSAEPKDKYQGFQEQFDQLSSNFWVKGMKYFLFLDQSRQSKVELWLKEMWLESEIPTYETFDHLSPDALEFTMQVFLNILIGFNGHKDQGIDDVGNEDEEIDADMDGGLLDDEFTNVAPKNGDEIREWNAKLMVLRDQRYEAQNGNGTDRNVSLVTEVVTPPVKKRQRKPKSFPMRSAQLKGNEELKYVGQDLLGPGSGELIASGDIYASSELRLKKGLSKTELQSMFEILFERKGELFPIYQNGDYGDKQEIKEYMRLRFALRDLNREQVFQLIDGQLNDEQAEELKEILSKQMEQDRDSLAKKSARWQQLSWGEWNVPEKESAAELLFSFDPDVRRQTTLLLVNAAQRYFGKVYTTPEDQTDIENKLIENSRKNKRPYLIVLHDKLAIVEYYYDISFFIGNQGMVVLPLQDQFLPQDQEIVKRIAQMTRQWAMEQHRSPKDTDIISQFPTAEQEKVKEILSLLIHIGKEQEFERELKSPPFERQPKDFISDSFFLSNSNPVPNPEGGVDLTPERFKVMEIQNTSPDTVPLDLEQLELVPIEGVFPVITSITPVTNLPFILGMTESEENIVIGSLSLANI